MAKKKDLPAMPFYIGDWRKDPGVLALDRFQKSLWFDIICLMWESEERGFLTFNNEKIPTNLLANMLNENTEILEKNIKFFEELNLFSRDKKGRIYSRKIIKIIQLSEKRRVAGKASAKQRGQQMVNKTSTNGIANTENENENENESENETTVGKINNKEVGIKLEGKPKKNGKYYKPDLEVTVLNRYGDKVVGKMGKIIDDMIGRYPGITSIQDREKIAEKIIKYPEYPLSTAISLEIESSGCFRNPRNLTNLINSLPDISQVLIYAKKLKSKKEKYV